MFDLVSLKNYEENAAYTTRLNAQVSEIINFTSKLAMTFYM